MPRDVEPAVNQLDGVYLYDMDSLQRLAAQSLETRRQDIALCEQMIERHVIEFTNWLAGAPRLSASEPRPISLSPQTSES